MDGRVLWVAFGRWSPDPALRRLALQGFRSRRTGRLPQSGTGTSTGSLTIPVDPFACRPPAPDPQQHNRPVVVTPHALAGTQLRSADVRERPRAQGIRVVPATAADTVRGGHPRSRTALAADRGRNEPGGAHGDTRTQGRKALPGRLSTGSSWVGAHRDDHTRQTPQPLAALSAHGFGSPYKTSPGAGIMTDHPSDQLPPAIYEQSEDRTTVDPGVESTQRGWSSMRMR